MNRPDFHKLPPAPAGFKGWPWTPPPEAVSHGPALPEPGPGMPVPRISIVTPSFNQAEFLEQTIRSVLLQGYPDLEYIIMDGGSTDASVEIIKKYEPWLAYWQSRPDNGQTHAVNQGFSRATGSILAWINSDDLYAPGAFALAATAFMEDSETQFVAGNCVQFGHGLPDVDLGAWDPDKLEFFLLKTFSATYAQPATFFSKNAWELAGPLDESLQFCMDKDFFLRLGISGIRPLCLKQTLARFRAHGESKSQDQKNGFHRDNIRIVERYYKDCGMSRARANAVINQTRADIWYNEAYALWMKNRRIQALAALFRSAAAWPRALSERKTLGLLRRIVWGGRKT